MSRKCPATSDRKICVHHGGLKPAQTCKGDSGGPLILNHESVSVLIGVTSYSQLPDCPLPDLTSPADILSWIKCMDEKPCNEDDVSIFTNVQAFLPWIKKTTTTPGVGEYQPLFLSSTDSRILLVLFCGSYLSLL